MNEKHMTVENFEWLNQSRKYWRDQYLAVAKLADKNFDTMVLSLMVNVVQIVVIFGLVALGWLA